MRPEPNSSTRVSAAGANKAARAGQDLASLTHRLRSGISLKPSEASMVRAEIAVAHQKT
jgi:hypothetical protein